MSTLGQYAVMMPPTNKYLALFTLAKQALNRTDTMLAYLLTLSPQTSPPDLCRIMMKSHSFIHSFIPFNGSECINPDTDSKQTWPWSQTFSGMEVMTLPRNYHTPLLGSRLSLCNLNFTSNLFISIFKELCAKLSYMGFGISKLCNAQSWSWKCCSSCYVVFFPLRVYLAMSTERSC